MDHKIYHVAAFKIVGPYTLRVQFDDRTEQTINFWDALWGELYAPLRDPSVFNQVRINPETHTLEWPNGADFDPETLHDWDEVGAAMSEPIETQAQV
ncbi:MAG: DUF2442 domain-containing protein [Chloroflexi bacterium]|nr:DUF2442 domain-containing protein [Chloroflexota bacterium]